MFFKHKYSFFPVTTFCPNSSSSYFKSTTSCSQKFCRPISEHSLRVFVVKIHGYLAALETKLETVKLLFITVVNENCCFTHIILKPNSEKALF